MNDKLPDLARIEALERALEWALIQLGNGPESNKPRFLVIDYWRARAALDGYAFVRHGKIQ